MEHQTDQEARIPGEVVETYRQPDTQEVVETYVRPLPGRWLPAPPPAAGPRTRRQRRKGLWIALASCAAVVLLAAGAFLWDLMTRPALSIGFDYPEETESVPLEITIPTYPYGEADPLTVETDHGPALTTQEIYRRVNPSVVTILVQLDGEASLGTGVIFSEDGYILTNYHVLEGGRDCTVTLDNDRTYAAQYVAGDRDNDLAVLKVDLTGLPAATFGDSDALTVGDPVYAIGNPLGVELRGTLTDGIVSAINRDVWVDGRTMNLIQTNAALNSGNSGGPLVNVYGQVVGINTIKMSSAYSNVEGLGFAIPSTTVQVLVNDLLTYGEVQPEPSLGLTVSKVGTQLDEDLWGIEVLDITRGSAADVAGIQPGDFVVSANGTAVDTSSDLLRVRRQFHVGDQMPLTIWRDGELLDVTLFLETAVGAE